MKTFTAGLEKCSGARITLSRAVRLIPLLGMFACPNHSGPPARMTEIRKLSVLTGNLRLKLKSPLSFPPFLLLLIACAGVVRAADPAEVQRGLLSGNYAAVIK